MNTRLHRSSLAASVALVLALALGPSAAFAGKRPGGGGGGSGGGGGTTNTTAKPPPPTNFRVTAVTAYTISVAWDPAPANSVDFNYYLSGAYHITPAILPKTATSHTFTALAPGNDYWLFIIAPEPARLVQNAAGQSQ